MTDKAKAHAVINGVVQGVFFRVETQRAAEKIGVCGWVRNKRDGSVEAVFEGDKDRVDSVLEWCRRGAPRSTVSSVDVQWQDYTGEYTEFQITY
jgi:acylphosphatase